MSTSKKKGGRTAEAKLDLRPIKFWAAEQFLHMRVFPNAESHRRAGKEHIQLLREAHDLGDPTAGKKALLLAARLGLSATAVDWVLSPSSRKQGRGRNARYQTEVNQMMRAWYVYEKVNEISQKEDMSIEDACADLAAREQRYPEHPAVSGIRKSYFKFKSALKA